VTAGLVAALIICCLAISLGERTFDCLRDALLIPDGEVVAVEDHPPRPLTHARGLYGSGRPVRHP